MTDIIRRVVQWFAAGKEIRPHRRAFMTVRVDGQPWIGSAVTPRPPCPEGTTIDVPLRYR